MSATNTVSQDWAFKREFFGQPTSASQVIETVVARRGLIRNWVSKKIPVKWRRISCDEAIAFMERDYDRYLKNMEKAWSSNLNRVLSQDVLPLVQFLATGVTANGKTYESALEDAPIPSWRRATALVKEAIMAAERFGDWQAMTTIGQALDQIQWSAYDNELGNISASTLAKKAMSMIEADILRNPERSATLAYQYGVAAKTAYRPSASAALDTGDASVAKLCEGLVRAVADRGFSDQAEHVALRLAADTDSLSNIRGSLWTGRLLDAAGKPVPPAKAEQSYLWAKKTYG